MRQLDQTGGGGIVAKFTVGRKRRQTKRQPDGRTHPSERSEKLNRNALAQLMPHRRLVPAAVADDARAECIMGRLRLNGWLTEAQYDAGVKYRECVGRYLGVIINGPRGDASMAGVIVGPWGGSGPPDEARIIEIRNEYMRAFEALAQTGTERHVAHLIHDRSQFILARAKCGLDGLAVHYRLTKLSKPANAINTK